MRLAPPFVLLLTLALAPLAASADPGPQPVPTPSPTAPSAAGSATPAPPTAAPAAPATDSPAPAATATAAPGASSAPTPGPTAIAESVERTRGAPVDELRRVIAAASLAERIEAERRLAAAERDFLLARIEQLRAEQSAAAERLAQTRARLAAGRAELERLLQRTYRASQTSTLEVLLRRGSVLDALVHVDGLATVAARQRELVDELRAGEQEERARSEELARQAGQLALLSEGVAAKDRTLERLALHAERLVAASRRGPGAIQDAEIEILRDLADRAAREHEATDRLIAELAERYGHELPRIERWMWPTSGTVTQEFGPSSLELEPPAVFGGVAYDNFHDGIDIAAAIGTPVLAAARGRVAFAGHLEDGAMVVIVVHDGGRVSLYGHLDDTLAPPTVRAGDMVEAGQRVGSVGLTGITTGPHLHFSIRKDAEPVDPRTLIAGEPR